MNHLLSLITTAVALSLLTTNASNWPNWRGPNLNGIGHANDLPVNWDETTNILWKTKLPAWSGSSPIVYGDRVFVISPSKEEPTQAPSEVLADLRQRRRPTPPTNIMGPGGQVISLYCLSRQHGYILWKTELDEGNEIALKQNRSTPSPVTDGKNVWTVTGNGMVTALTRDGEVVWRYDMENTYGVTGLGTGYASSPVLFEGKLILQVLRGHKTDDPSYLLALDAATGKEIYYQERPTDALKESPDAYTTPTLSQTHEGMQLVVVGGDYVTGHDPHTGKEIWRAAGLNPKKSPNYRIIPSPVAIDGMIYSPTRKKPLLALRIGGKGDVTESHLVWKYEKPSGAPDVPTPICDGRFFYMVEDFGQVTCLDAKTGDVIYGPESTGLGRISASPVMADGKIYITSEDSETAVIEAGPEFKLLGKNSLDGSFTLSTPAVVGNQIFIRTAEYLYCISNS